MNKIKNSSSIYFTSLKPQKRLGEQVLREFEAEMGHLKSSSNLLLRLKKNKSRLSKPLIKNLQEKAIKLHRDIYDSSACASINKGNFETFQEFKEVLTENIKQKGNKANCWENAIIVFTNLLKKGEKPRLFQVIVNSAAKETANHYSVVVGLKNGAKIADPKTWGSKALVIDSWAKSVKPAHIALVDIETVLLAGQKSSEVKYYPVYTSFIAQKQLKQ